jgi:hypothetical protein
LTAGKFMRQPPDHQRRVEADGAEHFMDAPVALVRIPDAGNHQRLGNDIADLAPRIERGNRVLEDELHATAHQPQGIALHRCEILAIEPHPARGRTAQLQYGPAERRFPATGFADQTERLAAGDLQADARHSVNGLGTYRIFHDEIIDIEQRAR